MNQTSRKTDLWDLYYGKELIVSNAPGWLCGKKRAELTKSGRYSLKHLFKFVPKEKKK